ncbi:MAG TPA: ASPIC/UnbV domain-containing protein, partial [Vicinamibacteria bacterium]
DFDADGRLDLLISNLDGPPSLLRNEGAPGAWITVACEDARGGPCPIGTTVVVRAGGRTRSRDIASGDSFLSSHEPRAHFGLGGTEKVDEVVVAWPDGSRTVRRDVEARQVLRLKAGS